MTRKDKLYAYWDEDHFRRWLSDHGEHQDLNYHIGFYRKRSDGKYTPIVMVASEESTFKDPENQAQHQNYLDSWAASRTEEVVPDTITHRPVYIHDGKYWCYHPDDDKPFWICEVKDHFCEPKSLYRDPKRRMRTPLNLSWEPVRWHLQNFGEDYYIVRQQQANGYVKWAVERHQNGNCLNNEGEWEYQPLPSNRNDAFLERCRFNSFDEAEEAFENWLNTERKSNGL